MARFHFASLHLLAEHRDILIYIFNTACVHGMIMIFIIIFIQKLAKIINPVKGINYVNARERIICRIF